MPADMKGRTIGQYRVTGALGEGGMGVVYAAEHVLLGRPAAVKLLLPELSSKQEIVQRFFNEARAATAIRHPGIVEIYDFGWTPEGSAFIVMELLQGETLRARRGAAQLPWNAALAITRQIAGALGAAHAKGIVHRDLKPDNIFLVSDPEVPGGERIKLLDFGIAKLADSSSGHNMTRTGAVIGTPTYMAPEQCRGVAIDSRADLYSLGCILFELCSGQPPFVGEGEGDVLAAHIHVPAPSLVSRVAGLPTEVDRLAHRLLAKPPAERVQTAEEVIRLIDAASTALSGPRTAIGTSTAMAPLTPMAPVLGPAKAAPAAPLTGGTIYSDTTLSSGATSRVHRQAAPTGAPPKRVLAALGMGGTVALAAVIFLATRGGDDDVPPTASATYAEIAAGSGSGSAPAEPGREGAPPPSSTTTTTTPAPSPTEPAPPPSPTQAPTTPAPSPTTPTSPATASSPSTSTPAGSAASSSGSPAPSASPSPTAPTSSDSSSPTTAKTSSTPSRGPAKPAVAKSGTDSPPTPASSTVDVVITTTPPGAELTVNGRAVGKTPYRGTLSRSDRDAKLTLQLHGYRPQSITVHANAAIKQNVKLTPMAHNQAVNPFDD